MEIKGSFLFENGNVLNISFENRCAVIVTINSTVDKKDIKAVLRDIFVPFYCEEFVDVKIFGPKGDMTKFFTNSTCINSNEFVDLLVKVRNFVPQG